MQTNRARAIRGLNQRMYLLNIKKNSNSWDFGVEGSSRNSYKLQMNQSGNLSCSCPDFRTRHKICKHLYFIIGRIAKLESIVYLVKDKLTLQQYKHIENALISRFNSYQSDTIEQKGVNNKKGEKGESCVICFESLEGETVIQCLTTCKNFFHKECMDIWLSKNKKCPLCRADWDLGYSTDDLSGLLTVNIKPRISLRRKLTIAFI